MSEINKKVNGYLKFLNENKYVNTVLAIILILYASYAAPKLPKNFAKLFTQTWFQLLIIFLIAFMANKNPMLSILITIGFVLTIMALNRIDINVQFPSSTDGVSDKPSPPLKKVQFDDGVAIYDNMDLNNGGNVQSDIIGFDDTAVTEEPLK